MAYWPGVRNPHVLKAEESYGLLQKSYLHQPAANSQLPPVMLTKEKLQNVQAGQSAVLSVSGEFSTQPARALNQLEKDYSARAGETLLLHGGVVASAPVSSNETRLQSEKPVGRVDGNYILQPGDQLEIVRRGALNDRIITTINADGTVTIADLPPMAVAGNSLQQFRSMLEAEAQKRAGLELYANVYGLRQVSALVLGHVEKPGQKKLSAYSTVWEAVEAAGGIRDTGSWRSVKLVRAGETRLVDMYPFLLGQGGVAENIQLQDGDKIIIPPLGKTFALSGSTMQKGIFEMPDASMGLIEAMRYAGAAAKRAGQRVIAYMPDKNGGENGINLTIGAATQNLPPVRDGTILFFQQENLQKYKTVSFEGPVRNAGFHLVDKETRLSSLLTRPDILVETYPLIGVISRFRKDDLSNAMIAFSPLLVTGGQDDVFLEENDKIHFFSNDQIAMLQEKERYSEEDMGVHDRVPAAIAEFLRENVVSLQGGVRTPALYPVAPNTPFADIVKVAGGLTRQADKDHIEITRLTTESDFTPVNFFAEGGDAVKALLKEPANIKKTVRHTHKLQTALNVNLNAGDTARVFEERRKKGEDFVIIGGAVKSPGRYDLQEGDRLSSLLERAGGLKENAYPFGTVFSRESERKREALRYQSSARELELRLSSLMASKDDDKKPSDEEIESTRGLIAQLKEAEPLGRITVEANPERLKWDPETDLLLEAGDRIFIPQRPSTVRIAGEVLSPVAAMYKSDKTVKEYVNEAGGMTYYADDDRAFVVMPDGSAKPFDLDRWFDISFGFGSDGRDVPPGSIIFIPRDPKPFNFIDSAREISQILSNLAITGFFIEDMRNRSSDGY